MAENSKIEWCDHTFNPWVGCQHAGPACDHCYAEAWALRSGLVDWGPGEDRRRTSPGYWKQPLKWNAKAEAAGKVATVFSLSLGDIWDPEADELWRWQFFEQCDRTPWLLYLLLSKRIGNAVKMCDAMRGHRCLPENAALGATMVTQEEWDRDAGKLAEAKRRLGARFSFASVEPMLGRLDVRENTPDWIICGGESGGSARPLHPDWVRSLRDQCVDLGVPFFFKQWGEWRETAPEEHARLEEIDMRGRHAVIGGLSIVRVGKKAAGRLLDGRTWDQMPEVRSER